MREIPSETQFVWRLLLKLLLLPFTLLQFVFGKKEFSDVVEPFSDIWKFFWTAKVTAGIIVVNILAFIVMIFLPEDVLLSLLLYPTDVLSSRVYTLITAGFLHADIGHLFGNMLGILLFGRVVERKLSPGHMLLLYFGSLVLSSGISAGVLLLQGSTIPSLGASGALMGLVAAAILLDPFYFTYELLVPIPVMVAGWLALAADVTGLLSGVQDNVGRVAHIAGFFSVTVLMFLLSRENRRDMLKGFVINCISALVIGSCVVCSFVIAMLLFSPRSYKKSIPGLSFEVTNCLSTLCPGICELYVSLPMNTFPSALQIATSFVPGTQATACRMPVGIVSRYAPT